MLMVGFNMQMAHISSQIEPAIFLCYIVISGSFLFSYFNCKIDPAKDTAAKSVVCMSAIFALCGVTRLLHYFPDPSLEKISFILHALLLIASIAFVISNRVSKIIKAFE